MSRSGYSDPTDLERIAACARAIGIHVRWNKYLSLYQYEEGRYDIRYYDPRHNKAQAFDLIERLRLRVNPLKDSWEVSTDPRCAPHQRRADENLLHAIVVCASDAQLAKEQENG